MLAIHDLGDAGRCIAGTPTRDIGVVAVHVTSDDIERDEPAPDARPVRLYGRLTALLPDLVQAHDDSIACLCTVAIRGIVNADVHPPELRVDAEIVVEHDTGLQAQNLPLQEQRHPE